MQDGRITKHEPQITNHSKPMIQPVLQGDAFLRDVAQAGGERDRLHLWWLGQSGFLLQWNGRHVLLDPYLSDSLTRKYAGTDKPHVRMTALLVEPERLDFIDLTTSSHAHTDHLDAETLGPLLRVNAGMELVIPEANRRLVAERLQIAEDRPLGLDAGGSVEAAGMRIHAIPAAHNTLEKDDRGRHKFLGYVIEMGARTIYHAGDTLHYEGMESWLRSWRIDAALLPINGNLPERGVAGNLDGIEAASLACAIGARIVIPCHYDMFEFNTVSTALFESSCRNLGQPYRILPCGQRMEI